MSLQLNWPDKLDEKEFIKHYWQVRPLLMRGAIAPFNNPITPDELGGLATDEDVSSRIILRENEQNWHCRFGPFQESELTELPTEDWSLLVSDVEKHLPDFRQWLQPFHFIPQWRIDDLMISYAPQGASVGAHIDNYDVFLLQAAGRREWSINENPEADRSTLPGQDIQVLANFEAEQTWVLEPGDILYLPPGVPHHGISLDNDCMTWSIGFRAPSHREVISQFAEMLVKEIPEQAFFSDPAFDLQESRGEINEQAVRRLREIWNTYVHADERTFARMAGVLLTNGGETLSTPDEAETQPHDQASETDLNSEIAAETTRESLQACAQWERNSQSRFAYINTGDQATLFVDGFQHTCSIEFAHHVTEHLEYDNSSLQQFTDTVDDRNALSWLLQHNRLNPMLDGDE